MRFSLTILGSSLASLLGLAMPIRAAGPVVVHEWGTFTCLQDEQGRAIGGINVDDEPVPPFVFQESGGQEVAAEYSHDLGNFGLPPYAVGKGWAANDPAVTMRLETPVIYLYPPKGQPRPSVPPLDVHVDFHGGFLTQFYPYADAVPFNGQGEITAKSTSSLDWAGVRIGSNERPVETDDKVWTTPREVSAPLLQVTMHWRGGNGQPDPVGIAQAEHFLFYRGVGQLDSPLYLNQDPHHVGEKEKFYIWSQRLNPPLDPWGMIAMDSVYAQAWLTEIHPDGSCAFRTISSFGGLLPQTRMGPRGDIASDFQPQDFNAANLTQLKASMQAALVKEGLYPDEASAMLRTWELSYFKSPGLRFFYIVPRAWVDRVLPLKVTGAPTKITRVMVGRIELVTEAQRAALRRLAEGPCPDLPSLKQAARAALEKSTLPKADQDAFYRGEKPLSDLGIAIPPLVQDYLSLGRFRDALVVHEQQEHPSAALAQLIKDNQMTPRAN